MIKEDINWSPIEGEIMTRWAKNVNPDLPHPEYPRPQMKRVEWLNLNGLWDYAICRKDRQQINSYDGKILVPFPLESALSGVKKKLKPNQKLLYRRGFRIPKHWKNKKIILHFGAVDWEARVFINRKEIGKHQGGYTPFSYEISEYLKYDDENELFVEVWDPTDKNGYERGKQTLNPKYCWYTAVSGIWQTVWLEPVSSTFIEKFRLTPDIDKKILNINLIIHNFLPEYHLEVEIKGESSIKKKFTSLFNEIEIDIPSPTLWSPDNPYLYELRIKVSKENQVIDEIESYFGMRKISLGKEIDNIRHIELNNEEIFQYGTLDQGYWPDGLYTAPTDEALRYDIEITKDLGFNMIRKHVKVEPARWYYYCDKLGILVWQDMPNGGTSKIAQPFGGVQERHNTRDQSTKKYYCQELESMVNTLYNSPSIVTWVPFNEGWGQFNTIKVWKKLMELDKSRLIDVASGWLDFGVGDIYDIHTYPNPAIPPIGKLKSRAAVVGEFGGLGFAVKSHMWNFKEKFVYRDYIDQEKLMRKYEKLILKLKRLKKKGISAAIYTQITDIEQEINGLLTYDREFIKFDKEKVRKLNLNLY